MDSLVVSLPAMATSVAGNVGTAAVFGVGVGIVIYGVRKVWGAFRSM